MFIRKISFKLLYIPLKFIVTLFSSFYNPYDKNRALVLFWTSDPWGIILSGRIAISQLKKKNPDLKVLVVAKRKDKTFLQSPQIKNIFGFNIEDKILSQTESLKIIFKKFDVVIVPSITSFSFTDHILAGLTLCNVKTGISEFASKLNPFEEVFDTYLDFNSTSQNELHFVEYLEKLFQTSGLEINDLFNEIKFITAASQRNNLLSQYKIDPKSKVIGIYNQADIVSKKWDDEKITELVKELSSYGNFRFYFVGNNEDQSLRSELIKNKIIYLFVSSMDRVNLLKLISVSDLFITTNSNIMHLAGTTDTPQISLFGEFNPFKWAPIGKNKEFINKSDFVNAVETDDVLSKAKKMLKLGT